MMATKQAAAPDWQLCSVLQRDSVILLLQAHCCTLCPACMAVASAFGRLQRCARCWALQYFLSAQVEGDLAYSPSHKPFSVFHVAVYLTRGVAIRQESHSCCKKCFLHNFGGVGLLSAFLWRGE
jgi:hypothetical protein